MPETPEQKARREIDADLTAAGWLGKVHVLFGDQLNPLITELNTRLAA